MRNTLSALLCALMTASVISACGGGTAAPSPSAQNGADTQNAVTEGDVAEPAEAYTLPASDLGGKEINILNMHSYWGMYTTICPDELNGEILNDAVYNRNQKIEAALNCRIVDSRTGTEGGNGQNLIDVHDLGKKILQSGDDTYDVMYLSPSEMANQMAEGYFYNLYSIPELHLDAEYWDTKIIEMSRIGENLYAASGDGHLMSYDSSWMLFFNQDLLTSYGLDMPYDIVRSGKWTIDELIRYCSAMATLNSEQEFKWNENGDALFGLASHPNAPDKFVYSAGERYVLTDDDGKPYFAAGGERFLQVADKLSQLFGTKGVTLNADSDDWNAGKGGYVYVFANRRSAFLTAEIKTALRLREMDDTFGIVPLPKLDESQESYYTTMMNNYCMMLIPSSNKDPNTSAAVMDAIAMASHYDVLPVYYDSVVSQKGLRNEDSIEMLQIMRATRGVDMAVVYNWNADLASSLRNKFTKGDADVASLVEKYRPKIETSMEKLTSLYFG
ncbi:MAG: extracellular solute-binding protein [Clostridiales bacterium]|nr:extracellular solute-binding protein [Clostridiales bacterium]